MAFDFPSNPAVGDEYVSGGATYFWTGTTWDLQTAGTIADKVDKAGDTMTGVLTISGVTNPTMVLDNVGNVNNRIEGRKGGVVRWTLDLGGAAAENTSNAGSDFVIYRFTNDGGAYTKAMQINRTDGFMSLTSGIGFGSVAQATGSADLSKHISLYGTTFGFNVTGSKLNYHCSTNSVHEFWINNVSKWSVQSITSYLNTNLIVSGQISNGTNHIKCTPADGFGIEFYGGGFLYKRSGHGLMFRKHTANTPIRIENNDGGGIVNIATTAMTTTLTVEELIEERVGPLLNIINELKAEVTALKARK